MSDWQPIETAPENKIVETKIDDGKARNQQKLIRKGRLWFFTDWSMYVYYPESLRPAADVIDMRIRRKG